MSTTEMEPWEQARRAIAGGGALWRDGLVPEAHACMASGLRAAVRAWLPGIEKSNQESTAASLVRDVDEEAALAQLAGAKYPDLDRLREALAATTGLPKAAPTFDAGARPRSDFEWIWAEAERVTRFTRRRLMSPRARRTRRIRMTVMAGAALLVVALVAFRLWGGPTVTASAVFSSEHPAAYAIDGTASTEWILPDSTPGWIQVTFRSPRRLRGVRLINAHNKHYMDRGSKDVRVTAFSDAGQVGTAVGSFTAISPTRSELSLTLNAARVTHIKVDILSFFAAGGALAEIEVF